MAQTVRIDESTHALLKLMADDDDVSLSEELTRAVHARKRERFFEKMTAGYAAMSETGREENEAESAVWDNVSFDGLEDG